MTSASREHSVAPDLVGTVEQLAASRWAADLFDDQWRLVWVSDALKAVLGDPAEDELGYGEHILLARQREAWQHAIAPDVRAGVLLKNLAYWMHDTPGGREAVMSYVPEELRDAAAGIEPAAPPPLWTWEFKFWDRDEALRVVGLAARLYDRSGRWLGTTTFFGPALSPRLFPLLLRGDEAAFERMARYVEPARRPAAILFADLEASTELSRNLPTPVFFSLIREVTSAFDELVVARAGLVGKHVGDGVTAFFAADAIGSDSAAVAAAIETGRALADIAREAVRGASPGAPIAEEECRFNVAVHWAPDIYIGQLVTNGRLEITALGDEVNQTARIEQAASGGAILASKALLERLEDGDADRLGIRPDRLRYRVVADLPAADDKAVRDAGGIPVADVG